MWKPTFGLLLGVCWLVRDGAHLASDARCVRAAATVEGLSRRFTCSPGQSNGFPVWLAELSRLAERDKLPATSLADGNLSGWPELSYSSG